MKEFQSQLPFAFCFTTGLTLLIALIRLLKDDDVKFLYLFNPRVLLYILILLVGNGATTLLAVTLTQKYFAGYPNFAWFWISFLGVFGFEAIIKNINISIFRTGVLTINDWIETAQELAVRSVRRSEHVRDIDTEIIYARPESDFRYKIINLEIRVDIESPETARITEIQKLRCCVDRLNNISTQISCDGAVKEFIDSSGKVTELGKGKFRTVFAQKNKGDVFDRQLAYELKNSFMNPEKESWSIQFEAPTKNYSLKLILPADKILHDFKFYRILHWTHEADYSQKVEEGNENGRPKLHISINNLCYKEHFNLSWRWQNAVLATPRLSGN